MCAHYDSVLEAEILLANWGVNRPPGIVGDVWPTYLAPFIRLNEKGHKEARAGRFGIVPHWAKEAAYGKRTYNARSETLQEKPSFRDAWKWGQRCLIPVHAIYEPNWETGKHETWRIGRKEWKPFAIAGLYGKWKDKATGETMESFTMITVNADDHPLMKRFHKPKDEKRMVVILHKEDEDAWLASSPEEAWRLIRQYPAEDMQAEPRNRPIFGSDPEEE